MWATAEGPAIQGPLSELPVGTPKSKTPPGQVMKWRRIWLGCSAKPSCCVTYGIWIYRKNVLCFIGHFEPCTGFLTVFFTRISLDSSRGFSFSKRTSEDRRRTLNPPRVLGHEPGWVYGLGWVSGLSDSCCCCVSRVNFYSPCVCRYTAAAGLVTTVSISRKHLP